MNLLDRVLQDNGIKYEHLNTAEKETYNAKYFELEQITPEKLTTYIRDMKDSIAMQLTDVPWWKLFTNVLLKARLKNYILLEAFLTAPQKAEEAMRKALSTKRR